MEDKQVVKWLFVVAVVVIVVVEGVTFLGLLGGLFGGGGGGSTPTAGDGTGADGDATPAEAVAVGDDLLPETDRVETLTSATLEAGDRRTLTVRVTVTNTGERPYELQLGAVTTESGRRVAAASSTGAIAPGENATVTARWSLGGSATPERLAVTAIEYPGDERRVVVDREVVLARLPVRG